MTKSPVDAVRKQPHEPDVTVLMTQPSYPSMAIPVKDVQSHRHVRSSRAPFMESTLTRQEGSHESFVLFHRGNASDDHGFDEDGADSVSSKSTVNTGDDSVERKNAAQHLRHLERAPLHFLVPSVNDAILSSSLPAVSNSIDDVSHRGYAVERQTRPDRTTFLPPEDLLATGYVHSAMMAIERRETGLHEFVPNTMSSGDQVLDSTVMPHAVGSPPINIVPRSNSRSLLGRDSVDELVLQEYDDTDTISAARPSHKTSIHDLLSQ
jgi:hypothetical protein